MVSKKGKKPEMLVISGCLRGLTSYLTNFTQSAAESLPCLTCVLVCCSKLLSVSAESEYAQDIYKFTRMAIEPQMSSRYEVPRGEEIPVIQALILISCLI